MATVELVKQDTQELEAVQAVASKIDAALADGRKAIWQLAEALHAFDEMRGWRQLGYATLTNWLDDTDEAITRGTYYRLVRTWRKVVVQLEVEPDRVRLLDQSKVAIVADQIVDSDVKVDDALADVESLGATALREKYAKKPSLPTGRQLAIGPRSSRLDSNELATTTQEPSGQKPESDRSDCPSGRTPDSATPPRRQEPQGLTRDEALLALNDHIGDDVEVNVFVELGDRPTSVMSAKGVLSRWRPNKRAGRDDIAGLYEVGDASIDVTALRTACLVQDCEDEGPLGITFKVSSASELLEYGSYDVEMRVVWGVAPSSAAGAGA
jgi:hypothetical protein